jgi:hypothetical protein
MRNTKLPGGALLLAGAAAFAYYKYSKMSEDQKSKMFSDLKDKGKKLYDQYVPQDVKNMFGKKESMDGTDKFAGNNSFTS